MNKKIKNFTDLIAWKESYKLVKLVYELTNKFPQKEDFALNSQMRRAAVSVSSNIAEGFSRRSKKEKVQFYSMSLGSLTELQSQIIISKGVGYIDKSLQNKAIEQTTRTQRLLNGLIKSASKLR